MKYSKLPLLARCPMDGSKLSFANNALIWRLNQAISKGELRDRMDQKVVTQIEAGFVNESETWLYLVRCGIPSLLADEAVSIDP